MTLWAKIKYLLSMAERRQKVELLFPNESLNKFADVNHPDHQDYVASLSLLAYEGLIERVMDKVMRGQENRDKALRALSEEVEKIKKFLVI